MENDNYAVGAVVDNQKSIVFIYVESTNTIVTPVENEYTVTTGDEQTAMAKFIVKKPLSRITGHKMVPSTSSGKVTHTPSIITMAGKARILGPSIGDSVPPLWMHMETSPMRT